jgi:branched-chain amino acid transport system permease protein
MPIKSTVTLKIIALIALLCVPLSGVDFYTELVAKALVFGIFAMSLDLLVGFTGLVSFGHAAYFGIAAYSVALMSPKYSAASLWLTLPASMLISALAALIVGIFVLRTKGIYFIMVTLAFAQLAYYIFHDTPLGGGSDGIYVNVKPSAEILGFTPFDLSNHAHMYYFILVMLVLVYLFLQRILQSPFGKVLVGIKSNEHRMQSLGYQTFNYKLAAFSIAGGLGGVAGYLYASMFGFVTPELLSWHQSGNVLLMVILGGMGNLVAAVIGSFVFIFLQEIFSSLTKHWQLVMGMVIVFTVLFAPGGLAALPQRLKAALQKEEYKK